MLFFSSNIHINTFWSRYALTTLKDFFVNFFIATQFHCQKMAKTIHVLSVRTSSQIITSLLQYLCVVGAINY